jgi:altronate dehydratase large subunit
MRTFQGYRRGDGRVGVRNHVLVVSTISCANHVATLIAQRTGTAVITHDVGCLQFAQDRALTERTIFGAGMSPNVGAVLFVGLGCEQTPTAEMARAITGKPARHLLIQEAGGTTAAVAAGVDTVRELQRLTAGQERVRCEVAELCVSLKCGGSDFTTAIASNPAVGVAVDFLVEAGGTALLTETPGFPGSEHILARQARTPEVARRIYQIVDAYRDEIRTRFNRNVNDGNPSPGNVAGGITTLIEKSLGTIKKAGKHPIEGVLEFAEDVLGKKGVWIMDTPGHDVFSVSGPAAGGAHINLFTTGRGTPLGNAICPVLKICGNPESFRRLNENMDIDAGTIMLGSRSVEEVGREIFEAVVRVAGGEPTKAELLEHREFAIPRLGSTL